MIRSSFTCRLRPSLDRSFSLLPSRDGEVVVVGDVRLFLLKKNYLFQFKIIEYEKGSARYERLDRYIKELEWARISYSRSSGPEPGPDSDKVVNETAMARSISNYDPYIRTSMSVTITHGIPKEGEMFLSFSGRST